MPLTETTIMDQKKEFILLWSSKHYTFTALCKHYGISRTTGYKYVKKYQTYGMEGLEPQSRAPHHIPNKIPEEIEKKIIELRGKHHTWGAKKLQWKLEQEGIYNHIPARSTINNVLKRNDLISERKRRVRVERRYPKFEAEDCNDIWSADYKGEFRTKDNKYCYPLTICDTYSRHIMKIKGLSRPNLEQSMPVFESVFKEYGLPEQLHTDNGSPFANVRSLGRYTQLSVVISHIILTKSFHVQLDHFLDYIKLPAA